MTAQEKKDFEELQATVKKQAARIGELEGQRDIEAPSWAVAAAKHYYPYMDPKTGSYDFWRALTIQYRKDKGITV